MNLRKLIAATLCVTLLWNEGAQAALLPGSVTTQQRSASLCQSPFGDRFNQEALSPRTAFIRMGSVTAVALIVLSIVIPSVLPSLRAHPTHILQAGGGIFGVLGLANLMRRSSTEDSPPGTLGLPELRDDLAIRLVGQGYYDIVRPEDPAEQKTLKTLGIAHCIGLALRDPATQAGVFAHVDSGNAHNPKSSADLFNELLSMNPNLQVLEVHFFGKTSDSETWEERKALEFNLTRLVSGRGIRLVVAHELGVDWAGDGVRHMAFNFITGQASQLTDVLVETKNRHGRLFRDYLSTRAVGQRLLRGLLPLNSALAMLAGIAIAIVGAYLGGPRFFVFLSWGLFSTALIYAGRIAVSTLVVYFRPGFLLEETSRLRWLQNMIFAQLRAFHRRREMALRAA